MITDEATTLHDASHNAKDLTKTSRATRPTGMLRFWVARPSRVGAILTPPVGIWRGLVDFNDLVWRK